MLAMDVSASMEARDVAPTRLDAAKAAATKFVDAVPAGTRVGLVAFSDSARVLVGPTGNLDDVRRAIANLRLGAGTAIGEAIYASLDQLPKATPMASPGTVTPGASASPSVAGSSIRRAGAIVLLSDGKTTVGRPNDQATAEAVAEGVHRLDDRVRHEQRDGRHPGPDDPVPVD